MASGKWFSFVKLYFTVIAIVSLVGTVVGYGIALYQWLLLTIISDEEYLIGSSRSYELRNCEDPYYTTKPLAPGETPTEKTEEEIATCQQEAKTRILNSRAYEAKQDIIGGIVRGTLFMILFVTHYPHMIRRERTE